MNIKFPREQNPKNNIVRFIYPFSVTKIKDFERKRAAQIQDIRFFAFDALVFEKLDGFQNFSRNLKWRGTGSEQDLGSKIVSDSVKVFLLTK